MKRHIPDQKGFQLLRMLDDFAQSEGMSINDEIIFQNFIQSISNKVKRHRDNPIRIYGFRVEAMFAHIAAALGSTQLITEEDSGSFFSIDEKIRRPDFRLITKSGEQFFIEVKNFHHKNPIEPFVVKSEYLGTLKKYADTFSLPLKFAIFWSRWNLWTLIDASKFSSTGLDYSITLFDAMKRNEMIHIGDQMIGTVPPLSLRLYADKNKPRSVDKNGQVHFTIGKASIFAGGHEVEDEYEKKLAWLFMLHGRWEREEQPAEIINGLLEYTDYSISPEEYDKKQGFAMVGFLSELITSNYKLLTSPEGEILQLTPKQQPDQLRVFIPNEFTGKGLKLWRFNIQPNYDDLAQKKDNNANAADAKNRAAD